MVVAKKRAATVHALFLVRLGRINLPRSHLIRGCAPRLQFADVLDRIGAFPASERTRKELLVGALSPARPACISSWLGEIGSYSLFTNARSCRCHTAVNE